MSWKGLKAASLSDQKHVVFLLSSFLLLCIFALPHILPQNFIVFCILEQSCHLKPGFYTEELVLFKSLLICMSKG